ncbi:hypothetical protein AVEN_116769-1 [Araneus ventricosus]|uniref:Uncharacterized protein n=1 Tax=Araneus ventricosus TaxID=182803 RepID=A0A4Y2D9S7_ARAVE|nr:hypothetical protein AVEN_116769-1 [Araneus ventricosus]
MGAEGHHTDHKTTRMSISLEGFCSWTIMQYPTQQATQKNTFVAWGGSDWFIRPEAPILPHQTFTISLHWSQHFREANSEAMKRCCGL